MKTVFHFGLSVAAVLAAWTAAGRTLSVNAPDADGYVTVTIGEGTQNQSVLAAWANGDRGTDATQWIAFKHVVLAKTEATNVVCRIPAEWRAKSGAVRFFLMSEIMPYAHRYEYITRPTVSAEGALYADTGIKPDSSLDLTIKAQSPNKSGMCSFGVASLMYLMPSDTYYWYDFFGAKATTGDGKLTAANKNVLGVVPPVDTNPHVFQMNRSGIKIDGFTFVDFDSATITGATADKNLTLFGRNGSWKQANTSCSIYSAKLSMDGKVVRDYIPCMTKSKVTLYDRVNRTAITIGGILKDSLSFEPGPEVDPEPQDCGKVIAMSPVFKLAPTIDVVSLDRPNWTARLRLNGTHDDGVLLAVNNGNTFTADADTTAFFLADVATGVTDLSVPLPQAWWTAHDTVCFIWKSKAGMPYDREVTSLRSDATGLAHIRTGWKPSTDTTVSVSAKTGVDVCSFGVQGQIY